MSSLTGSLKAFNDYLVNGDKSVLQTHMDFYSRNDNMPRFHRNFYVITMEQINRPAPNQLRSASGASSASERQRRKVESDAEQIRLTAESQILVLLTNIRIDDKQRGRYLKSSLNLYSFFDELKDHDGLADEHKRRLADITQLIEEQVTLRHKRIVVAGVVLGPLVTAAFFLGWIPEVVDSFLSIPILGVIYTACFVTYRLYQNRFSEISPFLSKSREKFFLYAQAAIKIAAYSFLIIAATTMSPVFAILSVAASVVDVVHSVFNLADISTQTDYIETDNAWTTWPKQIAARVEVEKLKRRNEELIGMFVAVALTAVSAVWCFTPGGTMVTLAGLSALGALNLVKYLSIHYNKNIMKEHLVEKFRAIETASGEQQILTDHWSNLVKSQRGKLGLGDTPDLDTDTELNPDVFMRSPMTSWRDEDANLPVPPTILTLTESAPLDVGDTTTTLDRQRLGGLSQEEAPAVRSAHQKFSIFNSGKASGDLSRELDESSLAGAGVSSPVSSTSRA